MLCVYVGVVEVGKVEGQCGGLGGGLHVTHLYPWGVKMHFESC